MALFRFSTSFFSLERRSRSWNFKAKQKVNICSKIEFNFRKVTVNVIVKGSCYKIYEQNKLLNVQGFLKNKVYMEEIAERNHQLNKKIGADSILQIERNVPKLLVFVIQIHVTTCIKTVNVLIQLSRLYVGNLLQIHDTDNWQPVGLTSVIFTDN